jgi:hypothetical protein
MNYLLTRKDICNLRDQLRRVRLACLAAIELGDCHAVARLTCEASRLKHRLFLACDMAPQMG